MRKILLLLLVALFGVIGNSNAGTWEVACIKQGPARNYVAGNLKTGCNALPVRELIPSATTAPSTTIGYPMSVRSIPAKALVAEQSDMVGQNNFISLGFGGQIVMRYSDWIVNGPGDDITVFETTWGNPACRPTNSEQALIEVSEDGQNWITPGTLTMGIGGDYNACYNSSFDISPLMKIQYVRITDRTNPDWRVRGDGNDGYDVDGIVVNYEMPPSDPTPNNPICGYQQGVASQFVGASGNFPGRGIVSQRKIFAKANINEEGFPVAALTNPSLRDASGTYNFWSMGFGGWACMQLPYTVFDGPGYEFYSFETTWQNKPCPNYPEKANVSVSVDGVNWSQTVLICKDALGIPGTSNAIDLSSFGPGFSVVNYIKFEDATNPSDFGRGADGYDMDNIFISQLPPPTPGTTPFAFSCANVTNVRRALPTEASATFIDGGIPEEMFPLEIVNGNMVTDKIEFIATIAEEGGYNYAIRNSQGKIMSEGIMNGTLYDTPTQEVSVSNFPNGVYFLTLTSNASKETVRFVKN